MIVLKDLTKTYQNGGVLIKAVDNVNLEIKKGEFVSIVGHSGSGKTTLLSLIGGLTKPDRGKVLIDDTDIWTLSDPELSAFRNQKIGFIFQFASLISTLSVIDNLLLPTTFSKETQEVYERAKELLEMVELSDKINSYPSQLSGGQQRRVAIARAFMNRPDIILADEPTGDLDEETEAEVMELFHKVNKKEGTTFLMVTHSKDLASQAKKMLRMTGGRVTEV
jgi:putative ABC transport system ATP-binding protein/lipoprotein-releasing system ATP-binding protein